MNGNADRRWERIGFAAGIGWVVLLVIGNVMQTAPPNAGDSVQKVTSYFVDHRGSILLGQFLVGLGSIVFVFFLIALASRLGRSDGPLRLLPVAVVAAGVWTLAVGIVDGSITTALAYGVAKDGGPAIVHAMWRLFLVAATWRGYTVATLFAAIAAAALRTRTVPRWVGATATVLALAQVVRPLGLYASSGPFEPLGAFSAISFLLDGVWVLAVSILFLRETASVAAGSDSARADGAHEDGSR
jgi:hypothetical protein